MTDKIIWKLEDKLKFNGCISHTYEVSSAMEALQSRSGALVTVSSLTWTERTLTAYVAMNACSVFPDWNLSMELWRSKDNRLHWVPVLSNGDASVRLVDADAPFLMLDNGKQYVRPLHTLDTRTKDFNGSYVTVHTPLKHVLEKWLMSPDKLPSIDEHVACVDAFSMPESMPEAWTLRLQ